MINAFQKSRLVRLAVCIAAAGIIVFLWIHDTQRGYQLYIPIVATVLMIAVGYLLSRLLGNLIASTENTKLLSILHMDLDPKRFIEAYKDVPGRLKKGSRNRAVASSYLADGYLAAGDPGKALEVLEEGFEDVKTEGQPALQGLFHNSRLVCLVDKGKIEDAKAEAGKIEKIITASEKSNKPLAENLTSTLLLRKARISIAEGTRIDDNWLKKLVTNSTYNLRRLELYRAIAENAKLRSDDRCVSEYLQKMIDEGGQTYYADWAGKEQKNS